MSVSARAIEAKTEEVHFFVLAAQTVPFGLPFRVGDGVHVPGSGLKSSASSPRSSEYDSAWVRTVTCRVRSRNRIAQAFPLKPAGSGPKPSSLDSVGRAALAGTFKCPLLLLLLLLLLLFV